MKRIIAIILACSFLLSACGQSTTSTASIQSQDGSSGAVAQKEDVTSEIDSQDTCEAADGTIENTTETIEESKISSDAAPLEYKKIVPEFSELDDPELLRYVEDNVYSELVSDLNDNNYFVENVSAVYVSKEYLEEQAFNSQSNVFFGYSLADIDAEFNGTRYVFTLGDDGSTVVQAFEDYDDTYEQVIKNVAIGTGVILICVTVSVLTGGTAATAVNMIFATGARTGTTFALSSGAISFAAATITKGIETGDPKEALKEGALAGSEGFKWGAITGVLVGGGEEAIALHGATLNGLTMNQAAIIQKESKWPLEAIKSLHSEEEYQIYKEASLVPRQLPDGSWGLIRDIDWDLVDDLGRTNVERVAADLSPIDSTGASYELHHIGMKADSPLAILTKEEHHLKANKQALHYAEEGKNISETEWAKQRRKFWKAILKIEQGGV